MPAGLFFIPRMHLPSSVYPMYLSTIILAIVLFGSIIVESLRFRVPAIQKIFFKFFGSMLREEESRKTTGSTYVIGAALLCGLIFRNHQYISFMVLSLFILGDAIAAIVGLSIGRLKIGKKSLEGSLACFTLCMLLFYTVFPFVPGLLESWDGKIPLIIALSTSLAVTVFELIPLRITRKLTINDNLAVPVIAGFMMLGLSKALGL